MVDYKDGEIKDIVPYNLLSPEVQAISFAIAQEKQQFLKYAAATSLYAAVDEVSEPVLDLMALELNTQYYEQNLPRETKEQLVSQTLVWYMHAGTPSVLDEFLRTVLAGGYVEEWYDYGGKPYYFKAYARTKEDDPIPLGYGTAVKQRIEIYKNARSWLESFAFMLLTWVHLKVIYENRLELSSEFFARNNRAFLLLGGTWFLDGAYRLNGYKTIKADFYPMQLMIMGDFQAPVRIERSGGIITGTAASHNIRADTTLHVQGKSRLLAGQQSRASLIGQASVNPRMGKTHLRAEKNLWYLDNTKRLDGDTLLNAQIFEYEL